MDLNHVLFNVLKETFEIMDAIYAKGKGIVNNKSRLIFPHYSKSNITNPGKVRVSEQELRFVFVEVFTRYCMEHKLDYYYSVETPTEYKYVFSENNSMGKPVPRKSTDGDSGVSARFDLAIHDNSQKIVALIEFKCNESDPMKYAKDFIKLQEEKEDRICLFVDLIESSNSGTLKNGLKKRLGKIQTNCKGITYVAHSLCPRNKDSFVTVYDGELSFEFAEWKRECLLN